MKIYICKSSPSDKRYCLVTSYGSPYAYHLAHGEPAVPGMEERGDEAVTLSLDEERGALELPDMVGNNRNFIILRKTCADRILAEFALGPHEVVRAVLVNGKGRVHSKGYVVVNPHGKIDCLDTRRSEMDGDDDDPSVRIFGKFWLSATRVPTDRDIFRVKGLAVGYIYSERLVSFIREQAFTNFKFEEVQIS